MNTQLLDPEIADFVGRVQADWSIHPPFTTLPLADARAIAEQVRAPWLKGGPVMAATTELTIPVANGTMRVRLLNPEAARPLPALIYLHGGGFTLFSIETHDRLMREYAAAANVMVLGVDYPLSPEAKYPNALDAIVALIDWLRNNGPQLGIDPDCLAIGGDSAGANLALAATLRLRDRGDNGSIAALLLNYGAFSPKCSDAAEEANGGAGSVLDRAEVEYYFNNYVRDAGDFADPYVCPGAAVLDNLPPVFVVIPELDVLAEQSIALVAQLAAAGVTVTSKIYPGATHSFLEAMSVARVAREAIADGAAFLRATLTA